MGRSPAEAGKTREEAVACTTPSCKGRPLKKVADRIYKCGGCHLVFNMCSACDFIGSPGQYAEHYRCEHRGKEK